MELKPGYSRAHVKCCKLVVSDNNDLGIVILCILNSKNEIYSRCSLITEFTGYRLLLPNALFGFPPKLKIRYTN
jgi:hypothetical protein